MDRQFSVIMRHDFKLRARIFLATRMAFSWVMYIYIYINIFIYMDEIVEKAFQPMTVIVYKRVESPSIDILRKQIGVSSSCRLETLCKNIIQPPPLTIACIDLILGSDKLENIMRTCMSLHTPATTLLFSLDVLRSTVGNIYIYIYVYIEHLCVAMPQIKCEYKIGYFLRQIY